MKSYLRNTINNSCDKKKIFFCWPVYSIEYGENNLNCLKVVINLHLFMLSERQAQNKWFRSWSSKSYMHFGESM